MPILCVCLVAGRSENGRYRPNWQPQGIHDYTASSIEDQEPIIRGLHPGSVAAAYTLLKRFDFSAYNSLLDVAGGSGGIAITLAEKQPQLRATVVDLPATILLPKLLSQNLRRGIVFSVSQPMLSQKRFRGNMMWRLSNISSKF